MPDGIAPALPDCRQVLLPALTLTEQLPITVTDMQAGPDAVTMSVLRCADLARLAEIAGKPPATVRGGRRMVQVTPTLAAIHDHSSACTGWRAKESA